MGAFAFRRIDIAGVAENCDREHQATHANDHDLDWGLAGI
jgi:hypothetical protein